ncbi:MAG: hypothetical protein A3F53_01690 [Candidatus Zambryskibacteria bacterium RIFCSPHIGHO2_12_FULL_48_10]|nr:MAG: hypothetical protein UX71_C0002G0227 [Parcubacteria group bacterium GW2011_GWA1_47_10]OHB02657.1 MAG: hypothetical protein A3F53_01690 [Candidatus Zambryskibacteria bacterium RIFCSPHIGHO2_12_FULL_48_10]
MRAKILSALIVSLIMVGTALWSRLPDNKPTGNIVAVLNPESAATTREEAFLNTNLNTSSSTPLSTTDILSRQLFADYANLKSRGETSLENLDYLAERYADGILNIEPGTSKIAAIEELIIIPDSAENIFNYGKAMIALRSKYASAAKEESENAGDLSQGDFDDFISQAGDLYLNSANELLKIKVPALLAKNHLEIINNYFQSAEAMKTIAESSDDPVKIYAAIQTQVQNTKKEDELFLNVQIAMSTNGIIWSSNPNQ